MEELLRGWSSQLICLKLISVVTNIHLICVTTLKELYQISGDGRTEEDGGRMRQRKVGILNLVHTTNKQCLTLINTGMLNPFCLLQTNNFELSHLSGKEETSVLQNASVEISTHATAYLVLVGPKNFNTNPNFGRDGEREICNGALAAGFSPK